MAGHTPPTQAPNLVLTRSGHLTLSECSDDRTVAGLSEAVGAALHDAIERGVGELFLCLVTLPEPATMPPVFVFWRALGERYLTELCHVPEPAEDLKLPLAAPLDELAEMVAARRQALHAVAARSVPFGSWAFKNARFSICLSALDPFRFAENAVCSCR